MNDRPDRPGWRSLIEWALALALLALALIGAASIGMLVVPFAIVALVFASRRNRAGPEPALGGLVGVGSVCLFVAYRNRAYVPCPPPGTPVRVSPGDHFSCGGLNPIPWLTIGMLLIAVGIGCYLVLRRTRRIRSSTWEVL
jgi:hypothetical protein